MSSSSPSKSNDKKAHHHDSLRAQTKTTATMLTMDGGGDEDVMTMMQQQKQQAPMALEPSQRSSMDDNDNNDNATGNAPWWKRGLDTLRNVASNENDDTVPIARNADESTRYKPLQEQDDRKPPPHPRFAQGYLRGSPRESLLEGNNSSQPPRNSVIDALATSSVAVRASTTQEDALQEDCSFFYKAHDDDIENQNANTRGRFRALRFEEHQHAFSYQDAVDVLTPSFLQAYKSRYEQLNQTVDSSPLYHVTARHEDHELVLSENNDHALVQVQRIVRSETTMNSSIFYEQNGRVLMRLPIDAVRLVMDPDLEAGVLSVEQWRKEEKENDATPPGLALAPEHDNKSLQERPPLRYVLTVSPDLYRKIVSEMSQNLTNPFCGISRCCNENEKADIRIAIFILLVVFFVLFINTEAMGPHS